MLRDLELVSICQINPVARCVRFQKRSIVHNTIRTEDMKHSLGKSFCSYLGFFVEFNTAVLTTDVFEKETHIIRESAALGV